MRRLPFLTQPGAWIRSGSRMTDTARDAIAIERSRPVSDVPSVILAVVIGISLAALLAHWWAS